MKKSNHKLRLLLKRSLVMFSINIILLFILVGRLYFLQIYQGEKYALLADSNRMSKRLLPPPRGVINDRNGVELAVNAQNFQAMLIPEQARKVDHLLSAIAPVLKLSETDIARIKKDIARHRRFVPVKIKDNLSWEEVSFLMLNNNRYPGLIIDEGLIRTYPYKQYTAHPLGYVGSVSEADLQKSDAPLLQVPGFKIGKSGFEKTYDESLCGTEGNLTYEVNAYGRIMREIKKKDGEKGNDLDLTIDIRLQQKAYEAFGNESGAAVVLNVHTGEILAFVSVPSFDPNLFVDGISIKNWNTLLYDEKTPMTDKAVSGQYSPGSTFKIVVALAALEAGVINEKTTSFCSGKMKLGDHLFHCWRHSGHGRQTLIDAIKNSCDIYFYETALKLGIEKIAAMSRLLGLGQIYDLGLENQKQGVIPDKQWKKEKLKQPWQQGETVIAGIGQGYVLVTPLQLVTMLARVVNGGYAITPTFIKTDTQPSPPSLNLKPENINLVKQGMFEVVNGIGGTATRARLKLKDVKMGGKTGTTQVRRISLKERASGIKRDEDLPWKYRNHAWFMAYAPHDNPKYAVAVIVEHGRSGSGVAAPIASKILEEAIKLDIR
ncbi:MAG: penicillin-binding protein 2 [Alphaproteobacteria bacterium]|nr:penicillin-binding protein 2 [Alphaproteobacteria bacterium]